MSFIDLSHAICGVRRRTTALVVTAALGLAAGFGLSSHGAAAQDLPFVAEGAKSEGPSWEKYYASFQGKQVGFIPAAMGFDIAQRYASALEKQAELFGYGYEIRDPNWSVESAVQILDQMIADGKDIVVVHPLDTRAFNRSVRKAREAGVYLIFVNMRPTEDGDVYIGADHYYDGLLKADAAAGFCGAGTSGEVAFVQGPTGNSATISESNGIIDGLKKYPNLTLVAQQSADGDASKAQAIAATMLKQHPNLCAIIDQWDGQGIGIRPAIEQAGLNGKVKLITGGGGSQASACDLVKKGVYDAFIDQGIGIQSDVLNATIAQLFQLQPEPGANPYAAYTHGRVITAENVDTFRCWSLDE